jgi:hypothetical protein
VNNVVEDADKCRGGKKMRKSVIMCAASYIVMAMFALSLIGGVFSTNVVAATEMKNYEQTTEITSLGNFFYEILDTLKKGASITIVIGGTTLNDSSPAKFRVSFYPTSSNPETSELYSKETTGGSFNYVCPQDGKYTFALNNMNYETVKVYWKITATWETSSDSGSGKTPGFEFLSILSIITILSAVYLIDKKRRTL